jgi:hypothetical protein
LLATERRRNFTNRTILALSYLHPNSALKRGPIRRTNRALKKKAVVAIGRQLMVDGSSNYFTVGPKRSTSSFHEVMILAFVFMAL